MITVEALKNYGANTDEGLARCFNNEAFYLRLVGMGLADANFDKLRDAIGAGDAKAAFEAAHALKGSIGNLSLTPLFVPVNEMAELLRSRTDTDYSPLLAQAKEKYAELKALKG